MGKSGCGGVTIVIMILALGALLTIGGARSAVSRAFDLAEYKAGSPYYQALALHNQVTGHESRLPWALVITLGGILGFVGMGWLAGQATPLVKEFRLTHKALRPRRATSSRRPEMPRPDGLSVLPPAPTTRALTVADMRPWEDGAPLYGRDGEPDDGEEWPPTHRAGGR